MERSRAAARSLVQARSRSKDMTVEIVRIEGRTPILFVDIPGDSDDVVLLYGHYDKQPEFSGWADDLEPWVPTIKDGKLYGRGGADDGYSTFGSLTAVRALQEQGIPHAHCVVIIEGCEESGSVSTCPTTSRCSKTASVRRISSSAWTPNAATTISSGARLRCAATSRATLRVDVTDGGCSLGQRKRHRAVELPRIAQVAEPHRGREQRPDHARRIARRHTRAAHRPGQACRGNAR